MSDVSRLYLSSRLKFTQSDSSSGVVTATVDDDVAIKVSFGMGSGEDQVDTNYVAIAQVNAGQTLNLDLNPGDGSKADALNIELAMSKVRVIRLRHIPAPEDATGSGTAQDLEPNVEGVQVDKTVSNALCDLHGTIKLGDHVQITRRGAAGITVDGTHKIIGLKNLDSDHDAFVEVIVFGSK